MVRVCGGSRLKVATQFRFADIVTLPSAQSRSPDQLVSVEPIAGVAVSVTTCPTAKVALQFAPQLMPEGVVVTVPVPVPAFVILSVLVSPGFASRMLTLLLP
jgi:hypothetical protein